MSNFTNIKKNDAVTIKNIKQKHIVSIKVATN